MSPSSPISPRPWRYQLALALFALVLGLALGMLLYGEQLDRITLENQRLQEELNQLRQDYQKLRDNPPGPSRPVRELSLRFSELRDERVRLELNRRLRGLLVDRIVGTPVTELDPLLAARILDDRTFVVEDRLWRGRVQGAYLIWDTLILYLQVSDEGEVTASTPGNPWNPF